MAAYYLQVCTTPCNIHIHVCHGGITQTYNIIGSDLMVYSTLGKSLSMTYTPTLLHQLPAEELISALLAFQHYYWKIAQARPSETTEYFLLDFS